MFRSRSLMVAIQKGIIPKHELPVLHHCHFVRDRGAIIRTPSDRESARSVRR